MSKAERIRDWVQIAIAAILSLLYGATFGWNYGLDNQVVYLLSALRLVHPDLLSNDWLATQTTHYHVAFKYLAGLLMALSPSGLAVGVAQTLVIGVGMTALYFVLRELVDRRYALVAFLLSVAVVSVTRTHGPCSTYVFDFILQPSTIGSAAFLVSVPFFLRERWLASGIALAVSGLFHANFLILLFGAYLIAHLFLGKEELKQRLIRQLGAPVIVLVLFSPMILGTALAKEAKEAQLVYTSIRAPHHFVISGHEKEFLSLLGYSLLGLGAAAPLARNRKSSIARLGALLFAMSLLVWAGVGLSGLAGLRQATQLFPWRIAPHTELLLLGLASACAAKVFLEPQAGRRYGSIEVALVTAGLGALFLGTLAQSKATTAKQLVSVLLAVVLSRLIFEIGARVASESLRKRANEAWVRGGAIGAGALTLAWAIFQIHPDLRDLEKRSNVYSGLPKAERDLFTWMQAKTPKEALFLTPPSNEHMRFHGQRSIVVDWKSNPVVPAELLEWKKRLEDVLGQKLQSMRDLEAYSGLDEARINSLRERYGIQYVVVRAGKEKELRGFRTVYTNSGFSVLDVSRGGDGAHPAPAPE